MASGAVVSRGSASAVGGTRTGPKNTFRIIVNRYHAERKIPEAAAIPKPVPTAVRVSGVKSAERINISLTKLFKPGRPTPAKQTTNIRNAYWGKRAINPPNWPMPVVR